MKNLFALLVLLSITTLSFAQEKIELPTTKKNKGMENVRIGVDVTFDNWLNSPDSIKNNILKSRGANVYAMYDIPFGSSDFSCAIGLGIGSNNFSNNAAITYSGDTLTLLTPISTSYKANKLSVNYIDIPFEFRFKTKPDGSNQSFKFSIGAKAGYLINSHTKYKDTESKVKVYDIKNLDMYHYGVNAKIGYAWFSLTGYYALSSLFVKDKGPNVMPFSIGISITPN